MLSPRPLRTSVGLPGKFRLAETLVSAACGQSDRRPQIRRCRPLRTARVPERPASAKSARRDRASNHRPWLRSRGALRWVYFFTFSEITLHAGGSAGLSNAAFVRTHGIAETHPHGIGPSRSRRRKPRARMKGRGQESSYSSRETASPAANSVSEVRQIRLGSLWIRLRLPLPRRYCSRPSCSFFSIRASCSGVVRWIVL